jgi:hypothetical protein
MGVDVHLFTAILNVPQEAGLLCIGVVLRTFWDCKLAQFCPACRCGFSKPSGIAIKIEFFCRLECARGLVL